MFEIFNGFESILAADFFVTENARSATQGYSFMITKVHSRLDMRKYSFNQRIVIDWSSLKQRSNTNITQFKGHIGKYLKHRAEDHKSQRFTPFLDYNKYVKMEDKGKSSKLRFYHTTHKHYNNIHPRHFSIFSIVTSWCVFRWPTCSAICR